MLFRLIHKSTIYYFKAVLIVLCIMNLTALHCYLNEHIHSTYIFKECLEDIRVKLKVHAIEVIYFIVTYIVWVCIAELII